MARKYKYKKYYKRKGRWSANINNIDETITVNPSSTGLLSVTLQTNPAQSSSSVSQQYTVKNVEFTYEVEGGVAGTINYLENIQVYIMYVPQGMNITTNYPFQHPEYIMAYKWLGSPNYDNNTPNRNPQYIKTRLSRRLQTGDGIIFLLLADNTESNNSLALSVRGLVRYWTKAN